jgi:hypothetical protein
LPLHRRSHYCFRSGDSAEARAVGTTASDPLVVTFSQMHLTVENRSGVPIVDGELQIVPRGVMAPFRARLPRIEGSQKRELPYTQFYSRDGTPFRRGATRTRNLRIVATDIAGKKFEQEVPFNTEQHRDPPPDGEGRRPERYRTIA